MFMRPKNKTAFSNPSITRRNLLRGAAGVAGLATLQSSSFVLAAPAPTVTKIKNLVGTQTPVQFGIGGTDLGIPARCPNGRTLWLFGDTYSDVMSGNWRSPVALYSDTTNLAAGVTFDGAVGGDRATQLFPYAHDQYDIETVIPSDVITIGGTMYMHVMVNGPSFGTVKWTGVYKSEDQGESWLWAGVKFDGDKDGGYFQLITWGQGNDGYVYIYATGFQRDKGLVMYRVPETQLGNPDAYQPWGWNGQWAWGNPATPILDGTWGELCLRPLGGKWLFTGFNAAAGAERIDAMVLNSPLDDLYAAPKTTLIHNGPAGYDNDTQVNQLYGGYIIPGSTLQDFHLSVSQWNNATTNDVYHCMQFRVQNL